MCWNMSNRGCKRLRNKLKYYQVDTYHNVNHLNEYQQSKRKKTWIKNSLYAWSHTWQVFKHHQIAPEARNVGINAQKSTQGDQRMTLWRTDSVEILISCRRRPLLIFLCTQASTQENEKSPVEFFIRASRRLSVLHDCCLLNSSGRESRLIWGHRALCPIILVSRNDS